MQLRIAHLYPDLMNIYGDQGNIIALSQRCLWRGIEVSVTPVSLDDALDINRFDLFFGGGGQDKQQLLVSQDLQKKQDLLEKAVEQEKVFLLVCGTYQLFGHYFLTNERKRIPGIGIFDMITEASEQRKIGNVLAKWQLAACNLQPATLVGFENHSGNTLCSRYHE